MNVEIGAEAALFPEKEYIKGIFVAVQAKNPQILICFIVHALVLHFFISLYTKQKNHKEEAHLTISCALPIVKVII
jgi:hypothetical protein